MWKLYKVLAFYEIFLFFSPSCLKKAKTVNFRGIFLWFLLKKNSKIKKTPAEFFNFHIFWSPHAHRPIGDICNGISFRRDNSVLRSFITCRFSWLLVATTPAILTALNFSSHPPTSGATPLLYHHPGPGWEGPHSTIKLLSQVQSLILWQYYVTLQTSMYKTIHYVTQCQYRGLGLGPGWQHLYLLQWRSGVFCRGSSLDQDWGNFTEDEGPCSFSHQL